MNKPSITDRFPPTPEGEWRTVKVIFRANENIVKFHGAEEEVKTP